MGLREFLDAHDVSRDSEGKAIHLQVKRREPHPYAITCGSPERVQVLGRLLDDVITLNTHRGLFSINGMYRETPIFGFASLMGSPSIGIVAPEWLMSVDLENYPSPTMIRVGSSGSWQEYVKVNDLVISTGIVRDDGASKSVAPIEFPGLVDPITLLCLLQATNKIEYPYGIHVGPTICKDALWPDESPRRHSAIPGAIEIKQLAYRNLGVKASSMEAGYPSVAFPFYEGMARKHEVFLRPAFGNMLLVVGPYFGKSDEIEFEYNSECEEKALEIALEALRLKYLSDQGRDVLDGGIVDKVIRKANY